MTATYLIFIFDSTHNRSDFSFYVCMPKCVGVREREKKVYFSPTLLPQYLHSQINRAILYQGALKYGFQENSMQSDLLSHSRFPVRVKFPYQCQLNFSMTYDLNMAFLSSSEGSPKALAKAYSVSRSMETH